MFSYIRRLLETRAVCYLERSDLDRLQKELRSGQHEFDITRVPLTYRSEPDNTARWETTRFALDKYRAATRVTMPKRVVGGKAPCCREDLELDDVGRRDRERGENVSPEPSGSRSRVMPISALCVCYASRVATMMKPTTSEWLPACSVSQLKRV